MSNDKEQPGINISGQVQGTMVNVGGQSAVQGNVTINVSHMQQAIDKLQQEDHKKDITRLVEQLQNALQKLPDGYQQEAQDVARRTDELLSEATQDKPDMESIEFKSGKLKQVVEKIKIVAPAVIEIAAQIIVQVTKLHAS